MLVRFDFCLPQFYVCVIFTKITSLFFILIYRNKMAQRCGPVNLQTRVAQYFEIVSDDKNEYMYKCMIGDNCFKILNGKKGGNLVAHAKTHQVFFRKNFQTEAAKLLGLPSRRLEFIQSCTEMVTVNGQPFTALNGSGFKKLIAEELQALTDGGYGIGLKAPQCEAVKKQIPYLATEIVNQIKAEVKFKFVSLMVDTATKFRRSILGISLQYMLGSTIIIRTIGMINLTASHKADYIAAEILERLNLFDIKTTQLISVTTDNASNMTSMIRHFNEIFGKEADSESDKNDGETEFNIENGEFQADFQSSFPNAKNVSFHSSSHISNVVEEMESAEPDSSEDLLSIIDVQPDVDTLLRDLETIFAELTLNVMGIRCAAHTLQLAVQNALKLSAFQILIRLCRVVIKELRKTSRQHELDSKNIAYEIPRLDCKTRWNSTYTMVSTYNGKFRAIQDRKTYYPLIR